MTALSMRGVHKSFRGRSALHDCTFEVGRGSVTALVGANGAGKSTLMSIAVGMLAADSGEVAVLGHARSRAGISPGLAYVAQHKPLYRSFTVADMLRFGEHANSHWDHDYARGLVADADVPEEARVKTLSPGQRTRVALALALGRRPEVLLLDEPLADLDPLARKAVARTLMADVAERGTAVLLSSHVLAEVDEMADRLLVLGHGRIRLSGALDDLLAEHYLLIGSGDPATVIGAGEVVETRPGGRTHLVRGPRAAAGGDWLTEAASLDDIVLAHLAAPEEVA
ncbi:ABC transporter ATP-binding protein [Rhodococcus spelaei]|uniref:ABC transporter ATP-binding protein n=1 Tax=Rhodococcus spelaei TaxID=2546320 RepID=A0A541BAL2_9NOCA|nr:ABC transporter ATP-binding protein [Rhodococcus spelaei]TQF69381.1 ABC transporter ATP-binding protein [Rhodococcus spelaei]